MEKLTSEFLIQCKRKISNPWSNQKTEGDNKITIIRYIFHRDKPFAGSATLSTNTLNEKSVTTFQKFASWPQHIFMPSSSAAVVRLRRLSWRIYPFVRILTKVRFMNHRKRGRFRASFHSTKDTWLSPLHVGRENGYKLSGQWFMESFGRTS